MKLKSILICLLIACGLALQAQDYKVIGVESLPLDMTAREHIKQDERGRQCAVFRIATQNITPEHRLGFHFESDWNSFVVERQIVEGEIWVWVSPGLKTLKVKHSQLGNIELHTANYGITVEALHTYKIVIQGTMVSNPNEKPEIKQQYLAFQISPTNAVLEVEGELWEVASDGSAMKFVNFGTYNYRVQAPNYHPEIGIVTVNDPENTQKVIVTLKPDFVKVTLKVDADAEIWVNNEKKGIRSWTGNLGKGNYKIECKQAGHETSLITKEITADLNGQTINLPKPTPVYGSLNIESTPSFATVYIDGKEVGETPKFIKEIFVGKHEIRITKEGYYDKTQYVTIDRDMRNQAVISLDEKRNGQNNISNSSISADDQVFTVNGVSFTMKYVEGGTFQMGATSEQGSEADNNEKPVHSVTLNNYYIGETEVTQALWKAVMGSNPSRFKGDNLPVEKVGWNDCQEFIRKLNQKTGKNFRLPTEAEWEYAARGGRTGKGYKYAGSNTIDNVAWYTQNTNDKGTKPVKTKSPNELGLYDMSGNVWEWCSDRYGNYSSGSQTNPQGPSSGSYRVLRGGSWSNGARYCRVSDRDFSFPDYMGSRHGFRLCLSE